ncbi:MAG: transposase [Candidatus Omnitrophica bacterium]|nr:transposase [Candidatus Omnitrophota bacterium]
MPVTSRILIEYACYHIITRGNQKQRIFSENNDHARYLGILKRAKKKYKISLYSYCLMPNHVHLLIEAEEVEKISKFMQWVNRGYTACFNSKYDKVGHLWQGRFKSKPILKGEYLVHCSTYIEENPVRANMVDDPVKYKWSSYRERCLIAGKSMLDEIRVQL